MDHKFWLFTCPVVLFSTWIVWIPGVTLVYALPSALQMPLFNLIACFFVLVLAMATTNQSRSSDE